MNKSNTPTTVLMVDDEDDYILTLELLSKIETGEFKLDWISIITFDCTLKTT